MKKYLSARVLAAVLEACSSQAAFVLLHEVGGISRAAAAVRNVPIWGKAPVGAPEVQHG
ncbi:hypothetical protein ACV229_26870 [Burkholderia sp. MR1-5-21]